MRVSRRGVVRDASVSFYTLDEQVLGVFLPPLRRLVPGARAIIVILVREEERVYADSFSLSLSLSLSHHARVEPTLQHRRLARRQQIACG